MISNILTLLFFLSGFTAIFAKSTQKKKLFYFSKPLTMLLLIALLYFTKEPTQLLFLPVLIAFIFSLFGDVFLMLGDEGFVYGMIAFLLAQVVYSFAFMQQVSVYNYYLLIPIFILTFGFYLFIVNNLGKYRRPVSIYVSIITLMLWVAVNRFVFETSLQNTYIFSGAILFVVSDGLLSVNKFKQKFPFAEAIILLTYYAAQYLFLMAV